jgi:transducin (beta)-like 1
LPADAVTTLQGHASEVFICAWAPGGGPARLATGSGDATARVWDVSAARAGSGCGSSAALILRHAPAPGAAVAAGSGAGDKARDVTTLDWHPDGGRLATGSYDGLARVWDVPSDLGSAGGGGGEASAPLHTLAGHGGPVFSLKWHRGGGLLLSGSVDKTAIVWDASTGRALHTVACHAAPVLDVDWRPVDGAPGAGGGSVDAADPATPCFATCSTDRRVQVCGLGAGAPLATLAGHADEVNAVRWSPDGARLASCSDDGTARVWDPSPAAAASPCVATLAGHAKEVYTLRWAPAGGPRGGEMLATASFDATVRLWDAAAGVCVATLAGHAQPVYSVAFSPDGAYVASGAFDRCLHVWRCADGALVRTFRGKGGIFEVAWDPSGAPTVAACCADKTVAVVDLRL